MRDFKDQLNPQVKKTQRHIFRKVILFVVISVIATFYFLHTEPDIETSIEPAVSVSSISLPEITQTTPTDLQPSPIKIPQTEEPPVDLLPAEVIAEDQPELIESINIEISEIEPEVTSDEAPVQADEKPLPVMTATWETYTIKSGDSLANIFKEWNLSASTLHKIVTSSKLAKTLADIHPGETLKLLRDDDKSLLELVVVRSPTESLVISKTDKGYESEIVKREVDVQLAFASGTINTSLFIDGQNAGLTDAQIMEMAGIFGWDIDFALEIREGDTFKLLYEEHYLDGEKFRNGPILMAEFNNDGNTFKAVRYTTPDDITSYYDPDDGRNKKRTFIRTPVKFARISSRFTNRRFHPVLKKWRSHRGVDYAAPTGTPIKATGNGKVIFRGTKGGYGKTVMIQHGAKYTTLYAHLSKYAKSSKKGRTVKQGQIIGYVGSTGLASGPHLHYEFRVNGVHRNPLTVKLPKADPINKKYRKDFDQTSSELLAKFNLLADDQTKVAQAEIGSDDS